MSAMDTSSPSGGQNQADQQDGDQPMDVQTNAALAASLPRVHSFRVKTVIFTIDSKYAPQKQVGKGAYGVVCSANDTESGKQVAIKKCQNVFNDRIDAKRVLREIKILQHLDHPNVVSLYHLCPSAPFNGPFEDVYLVMGLMKSDLWRIITTKEITLNDDHIRAFTYQTLRGLKYIHSAGVLHRDIKPSNLLVNSNCELKIADFGLSRGITHDNDLTLYVVTRWYRSPEIICSCQDYDGKVDVWAVGCVLGEMINRKPMFKGKNTAHQLQLIVDVLGTPSYDDIAFVENAKARKYITRMDIRPRVAWSTMYPNANPQAIDLLDKMLKFNPHKRISVDEALAHPYFEGFRDESYEWECKELFDFKFEEELTSNVGDLELHARLQHMMWNECTNFMPALRGLKRDFRAEIEQQMSDTHGSATSHNSQDLSSRPHNPYNKNDGNNNSEGKR